MSKTLKAVFLLDSTGVARGVEQAKAKISELEKSSTSMGNSFDRQTSRVGKAFTGLGSTMATFGIPFSNSISKIGTDLDKAKSHASGYGQVLSDVGKVAGGVAVAGMVGFAAESVKMAGDFQQQMSKLVTSGGEMQSNLKADMSGVEALMGSTGTSSQQLAAGLYTINSAGFHGAAGLQVLKAAAQGAKTENADVATVTDGVTTMLNDYGLKASDAAGVTSKMVMATSLGKTSFQDLAGSLHTVSPAAQSAGISMNEVLGAMATMTAKGTPAADAATYLRQTILQLSNPSKKASDEMAGLGLSSYDVSSKLGQRGLTGTLDVLTKAIASHVQGGAVMIDNLKQAAAAGSGWAQKLEAMAPAEQAQIQALSNQALAADQYRQAMAALPAGQAKLVTAIESGSTTSKTFQKSMAALSPTAQANVESLAQAGAAAKRYTAAQSALPPAAKSVLAGLVASKQGFTDLNSTIAKLPPAQQTAVAALAKMTGGTKSMQAALELTGVSAGTFQANVKKVAGATTDAKGNVAGWATVQKNFNQQLAEAKQTVNELAIRFGTMLIPYLQKTMAATKDVVMWFEKHKTVAEALAGVIGGVLAVAFAAFTVNKIAGMIKGVRQAGSELRTLEQTTVKVAQTLLEKFGIIQRSAETSAEGVGQAAQKQATTVEQSAQQQATAAQQAAQQQAAGVEAAQTGQQTAVEASAAGQATEVESSAATQATMAQTSAETQAAGVEAAMTGMATTAETTVAGMETTVTGSAASMSTGVEASMAGMATAVDGEVAAMATTVDTEIAGMATTAEGEAAGMAATVEADVAAATASEAGMGAAGDLGLGAAAAGGTSLAGVAGLAAAPLALAGSAIYGGITRSGWAHSKYGSQMGLLGLDPGGVGLNIGQLANLPNMANLGSLNGVSMLPGHEPGLNMANIANLPNVANLPPLGGIGTSPAWSGFFKAAAGGIVTHPMVGLVGEAGPEAIIPMGDPNAFAQFVGSNASALPPLGGGATAGSPPSAARPSAGQSIVVNVYVSGSVAAERDLARTIRDQLLQIQQVNGVLFANMP